MDSVEKNSKSNSKRNFRRKGVWHLFSCFNGGLSLSDEETKNRSRGKRHIVVPVENGSGEIEISSSEGAIGTERNRHKSLKDNNNKTTSSSTKSQQPLPTQEPSACHVASKFKTRTEPAHFCKMLDPVQAKTSSIHCGPREPDPRTGPKHDSSMGLCVLTVALAMLVLCGFTYAVIFMSVWFCLLYMFRKDVHLVPDVVTGGTSDQKGLEKIDFDSEEYKKMVVLRGFLDRDRRKTLAEKIRDAGL